MEPCLDPGQELQAAGRIHRLGQTRDVFIRRFAFRDSIEEAVRRERPPTPPLPAPLPSAAPAIPGDRLLASTAPAPSCRPAPCAPTIRTAAASR